MGRCPVYPKPSKTRSRGLMTFIRKRRSWLDSLYERSYSMKMGELRLPALKLFMPNQPELVKRIMLDEVAQFPKHSLLHEQLEPLLGDSIFTTNGDVWRRQRDMLDVAFGNREVERVFPAMQACAAKMFSRIEARGDLSEQAFDIEQEMTLVTADVIFRTIMSTELDASEAAKVLDAFERFQKRSPRYALLRMFGVPRGRFLGFLDRKRVRDAKTVRHYIHRAIGARYDAFQDKGEDDFGDILSQILKAKDQSGSGFTLDETVDQVAMLFLAGHETSASALSWSIYLLALYPEWQTKIRAEFAGLGSYTDWKVTDVKGFSTARLVFMEALRLYPPVGFFMREAGSDTQMRDKQIEKESLLVVSPWLLQRHTELWDEPKQFCPMRFSAQSQREGAVPKNGYIPFGLGPRVCIGAAFALQEATLLLCALLQRYEFGLKEGFDPDPVGRLTVRSENGIWVYLNKLKRTE